MDEATVQVGERVLASRSEDGQGHEEATVVDVYELLINSERRPMVVVDFGDGERKWMTRSADNIRQLPDAEAEADAEAPADDSGDGQLLNLANAGATPDGVTTP